MKFEFTNEEALAILNESITFREIVAQAISTGESSIRSKVRQIVSECGKNKIAAIKAVREHFSVQNFPHESDLEKAFPEVGFDHAGAYRGIIGLADSKRMVEVFM